VVRCGNVDRACILLWLEDRKGHLVLEVQLMLVLIDFLDKFVVGLEVALQGCYHLPQRWSYCSVSFVPSVACG
jgi:hypothetical protein